MDIQNKLVIELRERLAYGENVTLTRDEFNLLVDGDLGYAAQLQEEIDDLEREFEDFKDNCDCDDKQEEVDKLQKKLDNILEIIEA